MVADSDVGAGNWTQKQNIIAIETGLGKDVLLLIELEGEEALSRCFTYVARFITSESDDNVQGLLGKPATLWLCNNGAELRRPINGRIRRITQIPSEAAVRGFAAYQAEIVPALWFLDCTADCRIFMGQTVPDIVKTVLREYGITTLVSPRQVNIVAAPQPARPLSSGASGTTPATSIPGIDSFMDGTSYNEMVGLYNALANQPTDAAASTAVGSLPSANAVTGSSGPNEATAGDINGYAQGNANALCLKNMNDWVGGDYNEWVAGDYNEEVGGDGNTTILGNNTTTIGAPALPDNFTKSAFVDNRTFVWGNNFTNVRGANESTIEGDNTSVYFGLYNCVYLGPLNSTLNVAPTVTANVGPNSTYHNFHLDSTGTRLDNVINRVTTVEADIETVVDSVRTLGTAIETANDRLELANTRLETANARISNIAAMIFT